MPEYRAIVERAFLIAVAAFDWNCSQHITQRYTLSDLEEASSPIAEEMLSEALKYMRGLFQDDPSDAHAAYLYGAALSHMGSLEHAKKNVVQALVYFRQACDHLFEVDRMNAGNGRVCLAMEHTSFRQDDGAVTDRDINPDLPD